jgi:TolB-like protein
VSLISELRRRNVFRVGIAYLVVAWLLLQVVDVVAPMLELPDWALKFVLLLLVIGFPVALLLAWAFELTPEGIRREGEAPPGAGRGRGFDVIVFVGLIVALGWFGWSRMADDGVGSTDVLTAAPAGGDESAQSGPVDDQGTSIAVLPFVNMSPDPDQEYFSDGISEELLNVLSRVPGLRVASRTSAFAFKGENRNLMEIGEILEVDHILEGSVRKSGSRVRITAQLIDTANDRHLWSDTYDRELTDIFAIQDEISSAIVSSLSDTLGVGAAETVSVATVTDNMDAYDLYLQSQALDAVLSVENRWRQLELLERAVAVDPQFSRGWSALAAQLTGLPTWDHSLDVAAYAQRAREAAERSLSIAPDDAQTYVILADIAFNLHDWDEWQDQLERASEIDPELAQQDRYWAGMVASHNLGLGYLERGLELAEIGLSHSPDNSFLHLMAALSHLGLRRFDEALPHIDRAITLGYAGSAQVLLWSNYVVVDGRDIVWTANIAETWMDHDPDLLPLVPHARRLLFGDGMDREVEARRFWRVAEELGFSREELLGPSPRWGTRLDHGILMALSEFEPIVGQYWGNSPMFWMWGPTHRRFRQSAEFKARVRDSGMLDFWRENGWPDLCRPLDADDFECE